jgi:hypothetical protein
MYQPRLLSSSNFGTSLCRNFSTRDTNHLVFQPPIPEVPKCRDLQTRFFATSASKNWSLTSRTPDMPISQWIQRSSLTGINCSIGSELRTSPRLHRNFLAPWWDLTTHRTSRIPHREYRPSIFSSYSIHKMMNHSSTRLVTLRTNLQLPRKTFQARLIYILLWKTRRPILPELLSWLRVSSRILCTHSLWQISNNS